MQGNCCSMSRRSSSSSCSSSAVGGEERLVVTNDLGETAATDDAATPLTGDECDTTKRGELSICESEWG